jgi:hypothetical protein
VSYRHNSLRIPLETLRKVQPIVKVHREPVSVPEKGEEDLELELSTN